MFIDPSWRILTVGDGDLSFSQSLFNRFKPVKLTATVLDSEVDLLNKYGQNSLADLQLAGVEVITQLDITDPTCWLKLQPVYDVVIFQFPLVPGFKAKEQFQAMQDKFGADFSVNTLNRRLLRKFLQAGFQYFLSAKGARLAYISSKDVKPYIEWNIEDQLHKGLDINYLGSQPFDVKVFEGYKIRNVDRDKHVKETRALTYVWSDKKHSDLTLTPHIVMHDSGCDVCRAGPFITQQERRKHQASTKHKRMSDYDRQWQIYLTGMK